MKRQREVFDAYLAAWLSRTGREPELQDAERRNPNEGPAISLIYRDFPQNGYVTGASYGLSGFRHSTEKRKPCELAIVMHSREVEWACIPAKIVGALRGFRPFGPGQVIGQVEPLIPGSQMRASMLGEPSSELGPSTLTISQNPDEEFPFREIELIQVYPLHMSERDYAWKHGVDALTRMDWQRLEPLRPPTV
ncbi:suppressor of fused domain protein [Streptomyces sp. P38-E01]|uniref:Suppressor of fused domain protein n=1 Tax=Streptomyces tardus TaxID=2780544 RepID=A0A949JCY5_9ACTN|nr:suppressor of fused domain protein [Streptomyces tardus]MBU7596728.1 suppressor of fused domain protein [Streptomyces tardus]